jgi:tight adherence protein B
VVNLGSASACAVLALAAAVGAGPVGSARLADLHRRPDGPPPRRTLPVVAAAGLGAVLGLLALGAAGAVAGAAVAAAWHRRRCRARLDRSAASAATELADALGRITEELRAGAHPAAALAGVRADGPLARAALGPAATAAALGDGVAAALTSEARRRPDLARELHRVAGAWALADRHGVPLADLLAGVHADVRWRVSYAGRVRAQLAGPRATAGVLTALPVLGLALGELVGAGPLDVLRSGLLGQLLVLVGVGLAVAGAAWTGRILQTAVPR